MGSIITGIVEGVISGAIGAIIATGIIAYFQKKKFRANKLRVIRSFYLELLYYLDPLKTDVTGKNIQIHIVLHFIYLQSVQEVMTGDREYDSFHQLALISKTADEFNNLNSFLKMILSSNVEINEGDILEMVQEGLNITAAKLQSIVGKVIMEFQERWPKTCPVEDVHKFFDQQDTMPPSSQK